MEDIVYLLNGRSYKTVSGLSKALMKDSGATSHSMVRTIGDRRVILCYVDRDTLVAEYEVEKPVIGKPMKVTKVSS